MNNIAELLGLGEKSPKQEKYIAISKMIFKAYADHSELERKIEKLKDSISIGYEKIKRDFHECEDISHISREDMKTFIEVMRAMEDEMYSLIAINELHALRDSYKVAH